MSTKHKRLSLATLVAMTVMGLACSGEGEFFEPKPVPNDPTSYVAHSPGVVPIQGIRHGGGSHTHYSDTGGHTPWSDRHYANSDDHWANSDWHWSDSQHHYDDSIYSCHYVGSRTEPGYCDY